MKIGQRIKDRLRFICFDCKSDRQEQNNMGFSLVELIVVIAIIAVLAGSTFSMMGLLTHNDIKKCTNKIVSELKQAKTYAMARENAYIVIFTEGSKVIARTYLDDVNYQDEVLADKGVVLSYYNESTRATTVAIDGTYDSVANVYNNNVLTLKFDRSSGAFKPIDGINAYCYGIVVQNADGSYNRIITITPKTGNVSI